MRLVFRFDDATVSDIELRACEALPHIEPFRCDAPDGDAKCLGIDPTYQCDEGAGYCAQCSDQPSSEVVNVGPAHTAQTCNKGDESCPPGELVLLIAGTSSLPINESYMEDGAVTGPSDVLSVIYTLASAGSVSISYSLEGSSATDENANAVPLSVEYGSSPNPATWFQTGQSIE